MQRPFPDQIFDDPPAPATTDCLEKATGLGPVRTRLANLPQNRAKHRNAGKSLAHVCELKWLGVRDICSLLECERC